MKINPGDNVLFNPFGISPPYEEVGEILTNRRRNDLHNKQPRSLQEIFKKHPGVVIIPTVPIFS